MATPLPFTRCDLTPAMFRSTCHQKSCRTPNERQPSKQGPGSTAGEQQPRGTARIWDLSHKDRLQGKALLHTGHTHPRFPRSPEGRYSSLCLDRDSATQKACVATQTLINSVTLHCVWSSELPGFNRPHRACASAASGQVAPRLPLRPVYSRSYMGVFAGKG